MAQYIDKSAVVAEIENLKCTTFTNFDEGVNCAVQTLLEIIDTLEVKEVDLEKSISDWLFEGLPNDDELIDYIKETAKHFFELGIQVSNKAQKG
jgi:hypothetical protein